MVESLADQTAGQVNIIVPNPQAMRGKRCPLIFSGTDGKFMIYGCRNNLVFKSLDANTKDFVYNNHKSKITALKQTPDNKAYAFGDEHGGVVIFEHAGG